MSNDLTHDGRHHRIQRHFRHSPTKRTRQFPLLIYRLQTEQELERSRHHFRWRWAHEVKFRQIIYAQRFELKEAERDVGSG